MAFKDPEQVWRDLVSGPGSSPHPPHKPDIRNWALRVTGITPRKYGCICDGTTDDSLPFTAFLNALAALGPDEPRIALIDEPIALTTSQVFTGSNIDFVFQGDGRLMPKGAGAIYPLLDIRGSSVSLGVRTVTSHTPRGTTEIVFNSVAGMSVGKLLRFDWGPQDIGPVSFAVFIARIEAISGSTVGLSHPLPWFLSTSTVFQLSVITPVTNVNVYNFYARRTSMYTGVNQQIAGLRISNAFNVTMRGCRTEGLTPTGDQTLGFKSGGLIINNVVGGVFELVRSAWDGGFGIGGDSAVTINGVTGSRFQNFNIKYPQYFASNNVGVHHCIYSDQEMHRSVIDFTRAWKTWDFSRNIVRSMHVRDWKGDGLKLENASRDNIFSDITVTNVAEGLVEGAPVPASGFGTNGICNSDNLINGLAVMGVATTSGGADLGLGQHDFRNIIHGAVYRTLGGNESSWRINPGNQSAFKFVVFGQQMQLRPLAGNQVCVNGKIIALHRTIETGVSCAGLAAAKYYLYLKETRAHVVTRARAANIVTLTTLTAHGAVPGSLLHVELIGSPGAGGAFYDGTFPCATASGSTLTYQASGADETTKQVAGDLTVYTLSASTAAPVVDWQGNSYRGSGPADTAAAYVGWANVVAGPAWGTFETYPPRMLPTG